MPAFFQAEISHLAFTLNFYGYVLFITFFSTILEVVLFYAKVCLTRVGFLMETTARIFS